MPMASKDEDLDRFESMLEITVSKARDTEMTFTSLQQTLTFAKKYDKSKLQDRFKDLNQQLMTTYNHLCESLDLVDQLNSDVSDLLRGDKKP